MANRIIQHRMKLQSIIERGGADLSVINDERPEDQLEIIYAEDADGCNALLCAVKHKNLSMCENLVDKLESLNSTTNPRPLRNTFYPKSDQDGNNILHLAMTTERDDIVNYVLEFCEDNLNDEERLDIITELNNQDESSIFLAINYKLEAISNNIINDYPIKEDVVLQYSKAQSQSGDNCLTASIKQGLGTVTQQLFKKFITKAEQNARDVWLNIIGPIIQHIKGGNNFEHHIIYIMELFVKNNCRELTRLLLNVASIQSSFYQRFDYTRVAAIDFTTCPEMRKILSPHCQKTEMETYYLIPKMTLYVTFIYTFKHQRPQKQKSGTEKPKKREKATISQNERKGAGDQYEILKSAFEVAGFKTVSLEGNVAQTAPMWDGDDMLKDLKIKLEKIKDSCSLLVVCVMCHGGDGYIVDSHYQIVPINEILKSVNDAMAGEIVVKVSIFISCREDKLSRQDNYSIAQYPDSILMTSCSEGERTTRQRGYTEALAEQLRNGEKKFHKIHRKIAAHLKSSANIGSKSINQMPVYRENIAKVHLRLP